MKQPHSYIVHLQYLGYRYHGWIRQLDTKTVQGTFEKTLKYVLGHGEFKTLGASRTDAKVSANHYIMQLFLNKEQATEKLLEALNQNLPSDIRILKIESISADFNILQAVNLKEYIYLFSFGQKSSPLCASMMANFPENLNINLMKKGAKVFVGEHDFRNYCKKPSAETETIRKIQLCEIKENRIYSANFFPENSFVFRVKAAGFLRYQIRMMMGQLVLLGKGTITIEDLMSSFDAYNPVSFIAPAAGLHLQEITYWS